jgi:hypothetical protein
MALFFPGNSPRAKEYGGLATQKRNPATRFDLVSGEEITQMEDHIYISYLTSDKAEFLHQYNFTHLSRKHLHEWTHRLKVIEELKKLMDSDKWQGWWPGYKGPDYLELLINQLNKVPGTDLALI